VLPLPELELAVELWLVPLPELELLLATQTLFTQTWEARHTAPPQGTPPDELPLELELVPVPPSVPAVLPQLQPSTTESNANRGNADQIKDLDIMIPSPSDGPGDSQATRFSRVIRDFLPERGECCPVSTQRL